MNRQAQEISEEETSTAGSSRQSLETLDPEPTVDAASDRLGTVSPGSKAANSPLFIEARASRPRPSGPDQPGSEPELNIPDETRRVREVYEQREQRLVSNHGAPLDLYERCAIHEREELLVRIFRELGMTTLAGLRILDVGCGSGALLRHLCDYGADPQNCFGIDILGKRLENAKRLGSHLGLALASGAQLPFPDETFDLVLQFTVLTSVLAWKLKQAIAAEMLRVLPRGGRFIWYDFAYNNPRNPDVRGIGRREIRQLLPGCRLRFWRVTLAPPVGRLAVRFNPFLYRALSELRFLCSHNFCVAEKL
jgi:ubiquinone/menaquinone biosynthesis C-methylase UbiE